MILSRLVTLFAAVLILASCGSPSKFRTYNGPEVTQIRVYKAERRMELWHHDRMLRTFRVDLGNPNGHKQQEGDRRTPEGRYFIDRRNPDSRFHLSIGISYPNAADRASAAARGVSPGGDIFIHGRGPRFQNVRGDWTDGCIAVTDRQMEDIYAMVRNGTPIDIFASRAASRQGKRPVAVNLPRPEPVNYGGAVPGPETGPARASAVVSPVSGPPGIMPPPRPMPQGTAP
ncbi:L,D-transpeptidase family protein [Rhodobacteraceae bacterium 2376]|uniref:L,D-transpeptidase family protein n=1 Tax=Rhabdonatronobacter sediminivivens TaxID=2743469 RepID=A0A7Z0L0J0_9RHOB|nr:L,D-transpeptidase family protein [Rhabdonatronobacter sediminivivens]NYS26256.1 L,D-transpeptidase family protein [Rhabdonatronobacter sediminivivens]